MRLGWGIGVDRNIVCGLCLSVLWGSVVYGSHDLSLDPHFLLSVLFLSLFSIFLVLFSSSSLPFLCLSSLFPLPLSPLSPLFPQEPWWPGGPVEGDIDGAQQNQGIHDLVPRPCWLCRGGMLTLITLTESLKWFLGVRAVLSPSRRISQVQVPLYWLAGLNPLLDLP